MTDDNTNTDDAPDNWREMDSDEVKKAMGFRQVDGVVWTKED